MTFSSRPSFRFCADYFFLVEATFREIGAPVSDDEGGDEDDEDDDDE